MEPLEIISCADKRSGTQAVVYINEEDEYPALYPTLAEAQEQITPRDCGNTWGGTAAICVPTFSVSGVDAADLLDFTSCRQLPAAVTSTPAPSASGTQSPQSIPTSPEENYGCERFVREAASAARVTLPGKGENQRKLSSQRTHTRTRAGRRCRRWRKIAFETRCLFTSPSEEHRASSSHCESIVVAKTVCENVGCEKCL
jgi:hypothetical protein